MIVQLTEINKDDNSHSSGACFYILVRRCDTKFSELFSIFLKLLSC